MIEFIDTKGKYHRFLAYKIPDNPIWYKIISRVGSKNPALEWSSIAILCRSISRRSSFKFCYGYMKMKSPLPCNLFTNQDLFTGIFLQNIKALWHLAIGTFKITYFANCHTRNFKLGDVCQERLQQDPHKRNMLCK